MDLYDPDRAQGITHLGVPATWDSFLGALNSVAAHARQKNGGGFRLLTGTVYSPSLGDRIQAALEAIPGAQWHQFEAAGAHSARAGANAAFGRPVNSYYRLDAADIVVALDSDFLASGPASTRYAHDFAMRRRRGNRLDMNRL
jgi:molybdopterin-containing oxidoreductase family iron-sulfur binding subunit